MPGGGYRYYADDELGPEYSAAMDELFAIYSSSLERVQDWAAERWPRGPALGMPAAKARHRCG